jgi:hypothetical protein
MSNNMEETEKLLQSLDMAARDYTNGEGLKLMEKLLRMGAGVVRSVGEAVDIARRYLA